MSSACLLVLVSYNSGASAVRALQAFKEAAFLRVVVENGNFDSDVEQAADVYVHGHGNIGYGAGVNLGVKVARRLQRAGFEWVVFANPDVTPTKELVDALTSAAFGAGDMIGFGSIGQAARRLMPSPGAPWKVMLLGEARAVQRSEDDKTYSVGALGAIRLDTFLAVGGFDPHFFLYFEEVDLTQRVRAAGFRTRFLPQLVYAHEGGASTGQFGHGASFELGRSAGLYARRHLSVGIACWLLGDTTRWLALALWRLLRGDYLLFRRHLWTLAGSALEVFAPSASESVSRRNFQRNSKRHSAQVELQHSAQLVPDGNSAPTPVLQFETMPEDHAASALILVFGDPRARRSGYALRNFATVSGLRRRFQNVTCLVLSGELAGPVREGGVVYISGRERNVPLTALNSLLYDRQWMTARYGSRLNKKLIEAAVRNSDIVIGSMINAASLVSTSGACADDTRLVWDSHNYDPELWRLSSRDSRGLRSLLTMRESRLSEKAAASLAGVVSALVAVSDRDALSWRKLLGPSVKIAVAPNGADPEWADVSSRPPRRGLAVSFGSLGQRMTADGLSHFLKTDWPLVRQAFPDLLLRMVGRDPRADLISIVSTDSRLSVVPNPLNIVDAVADAEFYIFPQIRGYGSKLKVFEAIMTGRPIVATPPALVGIPEELKVNVFEVGSEGWVSAIAAARRTGVRDVPDDVLHKTTSGEQISRLDALYTELLSDPSGARTPTTES